jgi:hypothetical protein
LLTKSTLSTWITGIAVMEVKRKITRAGEPRKLQTLIIRVEVAAEVQGEAKDLEANKDSTV